MKRTTKRIIYNIVVFSLLAVGLAIVCHRFLHFGNVEYTDNAAVCQHITSVNTRVAGFIKQIRFEENQPVHAGDTLVIIEDAEFRMLLAQAQAELANALASRRITKAGITTSTSNVAVSDASIGEQQALLDNAKREYDRYSQLYNDGAVTRQQYDNMLSAYQAAQARFERAARSKTAAANVKAEHNIGLDRSEAGIALCEARVDLAKLNLSYCAIVATCDGVTGRKTIHEGQLVQAGQTMVDIVDTNEMWVQANYRESQLANIRVGAKVRMSVDAVPGVDYVGVVESLSNATGSAFSMMPHDNATGNFVKIEQRLPVRIALKGNDPANLQLLKAGYNVECEVLKQ